MLLKDLQYIIEAYGWLVAIALILVLNGDRIATRVATFIPPIARWFDKRRATQKLRTRAILEQDDELLHHEIDTEVAAAAHLVKTHDRMLTILEQTLEHFWTDHEQQAGNWAAVQQAISDNRVALMGMKSTLSLHTMTISQQADAYAHLECVRAGWKKGEGRGEGTDEP